MNEGVRADYQRQYASDFASSNLSVRPAAAQRCCGPRLRRDIQNDLYFSGDLGVNTNNSSIFSGTHLARICKVACRSVPRAFNTVTGGSMV
jgi:hypothetical protein